MVPSPAEFLEGASRVSLEKEFSCFKHRFTTGEEIVDFLLAVQKVIKAYGSLHHCFLMYYNHNDSDVIPSLGLFVNEIKAHLNIRENSLLPCPEKGSACKRLHLFLRWMVRSDAVDPGGWNDISPAKLIVPLDVHMHRICMALGMTSRKQADLNTALEITQGFRVFVPEDPVKYDFALTRIGIRNDIDLKEIMEYNYTGQGAINSMGGVCNG
jgi:uncharacterized protein (TIGR02757 family)